jgi:tetratricopeptide (TPR) repeat protein
MKIHRLLLSVALWLGIGCVYAMAQTTNQTNDMIKQGVELHNQGKYTEAIAKFNEALKTEPENAYANYEIAFSMYYARKPNDAIPHLEKAAKTSNISLSAAAYGLLASIYDEGNQPKKAIDTYNEAIKVNPNYPQIYYNLGIAYFRNKQFAEAEQSAIEAIKHDPKNASSQRLYALVTFHQNKRANALMGFCSFILLEPTGPRAAEAYANIQHILQGGVLKDANGNTSIAFYGKDDKETGTLNTSISLAVVSAQNKKLTGIAQLEYELKTIFLVAGELSAKKTDKTFFDHFFIDYFYQLAQSSYMPAFTHTITLTDRTEANAAWGKENAAQITGLGEWLQKTTRSF